MPAMAPPLRRELPVELPEESPEDEQSVQSSVESLAGMVMMFSSAPWFHVHAETLKTPRS